MDVGSGAYDYLLWGGVSGWNLFHSGDLYPRSIEETRCKLSKLTGAIYKSRLEIGNAHRTAVKIFTKTMVRPWIQLLMEPIVLLLSIYMAIGKTCVSSYYSNARADRK
jgi:hypothetical protein